MRRVVFSTICLLWVLTGALANDVYVDPPEVEDLVSFDGVRIDGTINLSYKIGKWELGSGDSLAFDLVHTIKTDPSGHSRSEMTVAGLDSFAVPAGRYSLRCMFLGGSEVTFSAESLGPAFSYVGAGRLARRVGDSILEVKGSGGWDWRFQSGKLVGGDSPSLVKLSVIESLGVKSSLLRATRLGGLVGSLQASYNGRGGIKTLAFGSQIHRFWYSGERQQLTQWIALVGGKESKLIFDYENDLLVRITRDGVVEREIKWEAVPGGLAADTEWSVPIRVSELGGRLFTYRLDHRGYAITCEDRRAKITSVRVLNPNRGMIDVIENGGLMRRIFFGARGNRPDARKVTRIEDAEGVVFAKYEYDDFGRVSAYWRNDRRTEFFYDKQGKHAK